ncbi:MAG TPA: hypothetical protein IGS53_02585 [Leptolyngbyaceae cyanobacterium M33_DOE_097]|uniref:Uncharacterized protein n=1 Tax=Oscillatoriales cyanobacterium SpSt-418 TaxID=2282169 RepID=A0A7C3PN33_9CYAN|nr:hypothetical protein [Leptolyngbyaceae cyanobacterium M33_DOE_097]
MKAVVKTFGLSLLLLTAIQTTSSAGGSSWKVSIKKMQLQSSNRATVVLKALEDKAFDQSCTKLLIEIDWQPGYLWGSEELNLDRENTALKSHQEALISLQREYIQRSSTRIGEMMGGLIQKQSNQSWLDSLIQFFSRLFGKVDPPLLDSSIPTACQFIAPGLTIAEEGTNRRRAVYVLNEL